MITCPNCSFANPDDAAFCENCGWTLPRRCPNCGQAVPQAALFCKRCGYRLGDAPEKALGTSRIAGAEWAEAASGGPTAAEPLKPIAGRGETGGERKLVTAVFTDIVGSTTLAEQMDPEEWREVVTGAHAVVASAVYRYEGTIAQLLGDGALAFFGAPVAHEDDAERAVRAALQIQAGIQEYAEQLRQRGQVEQFHLRVGLNSGLVVVGDIGSDRHAEYLAVGDTVNLAARLQSAAQPDTVLISEHTFRQVAALFRVEDRGPLEVKGKAEPVRAYRVLGERRGARREHGVAALRSGLVGRQRDLALLQEATADLGTGRGTIITIIGEAGIGKSRLSAEWQRAALAPGGPGRLRWAEGHCLSYGIGMAYHLIADVLRSLTGVPPDISLEEASAVARQSGREVLGPDYGALYPFLGQMMGLRLEDGMAGRIKYLDGPAVQRQCVLAFRRYLQALAERAPVVVLCEDIHWADPSSVEVLGQVLPVAGESPVIFALLARPDRLAPGWKLVTQAEDMASVRRLRIQLAALSETDSRELIGQLLQAGALPEMLQRRILGKSEGNPLFVEELLRMLIEQGILVHDTTSPGWRVTIETPEVFIPDTLQGILAARIDHLPEEEKWLLQVASVIGRQFPARVLAQVVRHAGGL